MLVDLRPTARLRGSRPVDFSAALSPILRVLGASSVDLADTRLVCDWIQYRANFRNVVDVRTIGDTGTEVAVDLRRCGTVDLAAATREALSPAPRTYLEEWARGSDSLIWRFNALYWQALARWEHATGRHYEQALPSGVREAHDVQGVRRTIKRLFEVWDFLDDSAALPAELYVVELGVGDGSRASTWLDEFQLMDAAHGRGYYGRLRYLMADYSPRVLDIARTAVSRHASHVSVQVLDTRTQGSPLGFLRGQAFLVYVSTVYDNLPTDELARIGGRTYQVEVRAYLGDIAARRIAAHFGVGPGEIPALVGKLLRLGPDVLSEVHPGIFAERDLAVEFWRECWAALRLEERYAELRDLDRYRLTKKLTGEILRPLLEGGGDLRMHVNNGAVAVFADTLPLLHPRGRLCCHDLFVTEPRRYSAAFGGPGKYGGSVVNWVNGPLLRLVGTKLGFDVAFEPLARNITTLSATLLG